MMKKQILSLVALLIGAFVFVSCDNEPSSTTVNRTITTGIYILNEGNIYSGVPGSLTFFDYEKQTSNHNMFAEANGYTLGGTPNDMLHVNKKLYVVSTDENLLWVIDDTNFKELARVEIPQPRHITADNTNIYVSSYDGCVYKVGMNSNKVDAKSEKVGDYLEDIDVRGGIIYVCNSYNVDGEGNYTYNNTLAKVDATTMKKIKDVQVVANPTQLIAYGDWLFVCSQGNYADVEASIQYIDVYDSVKEVAKGNMFDVAWGALFFAKTSYDENGKMKASYNVLDLTSGTTVKFADGKEVFAPCAIHCDEANNLVFISSYKEGDYGYPAYSEPGYVAAYDFQGNPMTVNEKQQNKIEAGVGPTSIAFRREVREFTYEYK